MDKLKELKRAQDELGAAWDELGAAWDEFESATSDIKEEREELTIDPWDYEDEYIEYLDEEGPVYAGLKLSFYPSEILKKLDPEVYSQGLHEFTDRLDVKDTPEYQVLTDEFRECEGEQKEVAKKIAKIFQLIMREREALMGSVSGRQG